MLGTEPEKEVDKEDRSQDESIIASEAILIPFDKRHTTTEGISEEEKKKMSSKTHKRQGNKKGNNKSKKKGKNNEGLVSKFYSRQTSRKVLPSD